MRGVLRIVVQVRVIYEFDRIVVVVLLGHVDSGPMPDTHPGDHVFEAETKALAVPAGSEADISIFAHRVASFIALWRDIVLSAISGLYCFCGTGSATPMNFVRRAGSEVVTLFKRP
jgi:hypothetical protein